MRIAIAAIVFTASVTSAMATMPQLSERPATPTADACRAWAEKQDDEALYMWGTQASGGNSRDVAVMRLALNCLGDPSPEIVGFGSSAGFDANYCRRHPAAKICGR